MKNYLAEHQNEIIVRFHIGRGGRFHNGGHKTFVGEENLQDVINSMSDQVTILNEDENGNELPKNEWKLLYHDRELLSGEDIDELTGVIDVDGDYNADICRYIEDCWDEELELIWYEIMIGSPCVSGSNHEGLRIAVSELLDRPLVTKVKWYSSNIEVFTTLGSHNISRDGYENFSKDDAIETLMDIYNLTRRDAENIAEDMEEHNWIN